MSEIKLKPCPFCGGEAKIYDNIQLYWVACAECGAKQAPSINRGCVINAWNTRKPMEAIVERLEEQVCETEKVLEKGFISMSYAVDYTQGLRKAIDIVKEEGGVLE